MAESTKGFPWGERKPDKCNTFITFAFSFLTYIAYKLKCRTFSFINLNYVFSSIMQKFSS